MINHFQICDNNETALFQGSKHWYQKVQICIFWKMKKNILTSCGRFLVWIRPKIIIKIINHAISFKFSFDRQASGYDFNN